MNEHSRLLEVLLLLAGCFVQCGGDGRKRLDKCPWDRADGKTEVPLAAIKGHWGTENARGPAPMLGMRALSLQCVQRPDANDRPPPPVSGAHSVPWVLKPAKWPTVWPLESKEGQGSAPPLPLSRCKIFIPSYLHHLAGKKNKTVNGQISESLATCPKRSSIETI